MGEGSEVKGPKRKWHGSRLGGVLDLCGWVGGASGEEKERRETAVTLPQEGIAFFWDGTAIAQFNKLSI